MSRLFLHPRLRPRRLGFTLTELMISIAIVLVLMLGINFVFTTSARTISVGMALTSVNREIRGARKVLETDFRSAVPAEEMPALIIHNEMVYAWKDKRDKLADGDNDPSTFDVDGIAGDEYAMGGTDPAVWTTPAGASMLPGVFNQRRHRIDRISFFVKNTTPYARQTGDDNTYVSGETSNEAWLQYGLLRVADNGGIGYWKPGARGNLTGSVYPDEQANHNNFFSTQWALGRKQMLLKDPTTLSVGSTYIQSPGLGFTQQARRILQISPPQSQAFNRESPPYATATQWRVEESRIDLAGLTTAQMREFLAVGGIYAGAPWWSHFADLTTNSPGTNRDVRDYDDPGPGFVLNYLSWAKPFVNKSNFANSIADQTRETALTTPIFLRGVTQFIVEFAGDFYDQGNSVGGTPEPLGTIDYVPTGGGGSVIRWYGMARDTNGSATITAVDTQPLAVQPLVSPSGGTVAPRFTGTLPTTTNPPSPTTAQKTGVNTGPLIFAWGPTAPGGDPAVGTAGNPNNVRPSLIRITMELIDSNGRLEDGQRIELVFPIK